MTNEITINAKSLISDSNMVVMNASEMGCYIRLLCHCWDSKELHSDDRSLAKLAGCSLGEFKAAWPKISVHFNRNEDGNLFCPVLLGQRLKANKKRKLMKKAADARWSQERRKKQAA